MRAAEALHRLIIMSDRVCQDEQMKLDIGQEQPEELANNLTAVAIGQAMLNTAIPVARFRLHIDTRNQRKKSRIPEAVDFTVSATGVPSLKAAVEHYVREDCDIYITLFQQLADRAEMLSGYQGPTQSQNFRNWVRQLDAFEWDVTTDTRERSASVNGS